MFSLENRKVKLAYAGFAVFFACLFVVIGMVMSDVAAQRDNLAKIECMRLEVVNAEGEQRVSLGQTEGGERGVWIYGKQERKRSWFGGKGKENHHLLTLLNSENGGIIVVRENFVDKDHIHDIGVLNVSEFGGRVDVRGEVFMEINQYGDGAFPIKDLQDFIEGMRRN